MHKTPPLEDEHIIDVYYREKKPIARAVIVGAHIGLAVRSPKDQFNRKLMNNISRGRCKKNQTSMTWIKGPRQSWLPKDIHNNMLQTIEFIAKTNPPLYSVVKLSDTHPIIKIDMHKPKQKQDTEQDITITNITPVQTTIFDKPKKKIAYTQSIETRKMAGQKRSVIQQALDYPYGTDGHKYSDYNDLCTYLLKVKKISVYRMAKKIGVSDPTLYKILNNETGFIARRTEKKINIYIVKNKGYISRRYSSKEKS